MSVCNCIGPRGDCPCLRNARMLAMHSVGISYNPFQHVREPSPTYTITYSPHRIQSSALWTEGQHD